MGFNKGLFFGFSLVFLNLSVPFGAEATTQAEYTFGDTGGATESTDSDVVTDASDVALGNGDFGISSVGTIGNAAFIRTTNTVSDQATAITNSDYLSFTIDLAAGETEFSIVEVSYLHHLTDTENGNTYNSYLYSSVAGGLVAGNEIASSTFVITPEAGDFDDVAKTETVVFDAASAGGYDTLSGPVTFWILLTDTANNNGHVHGVDNIVVTPEPGSLALMIFGGACLLRRPRRR